MNSVRIIARFQKQILPTAEGVRAVVLNRFCTTSPLSNCRLFQAP